MDETGERTQVSFSFKVIKRPPPPKVQIQTIRAEVKKAIEPVARHFVTERRRITDHYSHKPEWEHRVNVQETGLQVLILLKNARAIVRGRVTMATLLMWLFETGTKPHTIVPRFKTVLRFAVGGTVVFARSVRHPGFKANPALDRIDQRLGQTLKQAFDRGIRSGLNRAKKG